MPPGDDVLALGMLDEGLRALEAVWRMPAGRFEAAVLLGRTHRARGDAAAAIVWLERAVHAAPDETAARAALYDLGVVAETLGETARALAVFLDLRTASDEFPEVPQRIDRLTRVETGG